MAERFSKDEILDGKMYAVLSYLSILCIIPLILKKTNSFVLAHGKQGLVLFVGEAAILVVSIIFPVLRDPLLFVLFGLSFWGIIAVLRGQFVELPVVSGIADQITL
jgi:fumarate reductase subunit D